jgi:hypothetical protein
MLGMWGTSASREFLWFVATTARNFGSLVVQLASGTEKMMHYGCAACGAFLKSGNLHGRSHSLTTGVEEPPSNANSSYSRRSRRSGPVSRDCRGPATGCRFCAGTIRKLCGYRCAPQQLRKAEDHAHICRRLTARHHTCVEAANRPPIKATSFIDAQSAIDATLDALLPGLIASNESLVAALKRLRDFHLTGTQMPGADAVLAEVEAALQQATKAQRGF